MGGSAGQIAHDHLYQHGSVSPKGDPMSERFSEADQATAKRTSLEERLKDYPELRAKVERMLGIIENAAGDVEKAAEAERQGVPAVPEMGNEVLHEWARRQQRRKEEQFSGKPGVNLKTKKNSIGTRGSEGSR